MSETPGPLGYGKVLYKKLNFNSLGDNVAISGEAGKIIKVFQIVFVVAGNVNIVFKDGATALTGAMAMLKNGSITLDYNGLNWFSASLDEDFIINLSGGVRCSGGIYYTIT